MEPRYNEGPRNWQNLFAITRSRYIEVHFHTFCYYWGKENLSLYQGLRYIEVRYIMRFHCNFSEKATNDQTKKIHIILLITFHNCTIEKLKPKIVDLVTWTYWYRNWFCLGQRSRGLNRTFYYSFKTFLRFWLAKITRIIHQNQLLLAKIWKSFALLNRWRQKWSKVSDY